MAIKKSLDKFGASNIDSWQNSPMEPIKGFWDTLNEFKTVVESHIAQITD